MLEIHCSQVVPCDAVYPQKTHLPALSVALGAANRCHAMLKHVQQLSRSHFRVELGQGRSTFDRRSGCLAQIPLPTHEYIGA